MQETKSVKMIFIIGTGRSGTNWLGNILGDHNDIRVTIENPKIFHLVTKMAMEPSTRSDLMPKLIHQYNKELAKTKVDFYTDKSHPNIWLAEALSNVYTDSVFIGIRRNPYATIASMIAHKGVMKWQENWIQFPHPNEFLGTNIINVEQYTDMSAPERAACRWLSHSRKLELLKRNLGNRFLLVQYEDLILNTETELRKLENFIGLKTKIPSPTPKNESLDRWKKLLDRDVCETIKKITGVNYDI